MGHRAELLRNCMAAAGTMIVGVGTDVVSIARVAALWQQFGTRWLARLLHDEEREQMRRRFPNAEARRVEVTRAKGPERHAPNGAPADVSAAAERALEAWLARRFAAKEAASKALGTGIGHAAGLAEIAVVSDALGCPELRWFGRAADTVQAKGVVRAHLSLSDDAGIAQAFVVLEGDCAPQRQSPAHD